MNVISIKGLVKKFGNFTAVDQLDLEIPKGIVYGLLGPNGAGKTTTVRVVVGTLKPTSGEFSLLGGKPGKVDIIRRVGYMPQGLALFQGMTVLDNLRYFADLYAIPRKDFPARSKELLKLVGLEDWSNEIVSNLSGGMKHRLSLICTMMHDPDLLILDEPTVGVDPVLRESFWNHFHEQKKKGKTIVITTHYMDEARKCDIVGFMRRGRLIKQGKPTDIMDETGTEDLEDAFLVLTKEAEA